MRHHLDRMAGGFAGLTGVDVASVGTSALVGEPISPPMASLLTKAGAPADNFVARQITPEAVRAADLVLTMSSAHRRQTVTLVPVAVQHTFVLGELEHMLGHVDPEEVTTVAGVGASSGERLRTTVALAKRYRTPGVDPAEDIVDPYRRSDAVYATSFRQIQAALEPLVRLLTAGPSISG